MFYELFLKNRDFQRITENIGGNKINVTGLSDGAKSHFLYGLLKKFQKRILIISKSDAAALKTAEALRIFEEEGFEDVRVYPDLTGRDSVLSARRGNNG